MCRAGAIPDDIVVDAETGLEVWQIAFQYPSHTLPDGVTQPSDRDFTIATIAQQTDLSLLLKTTWMKTPRAEECRRRGMRAGEAKAKKDDS